MLRSRPFHVRVAASLTLAALAMALSAGAAQASSVTVANGVMTIAAKPGEPNQVHFAAAGSDARGPLVRVIDDGSHDTIPNSTTRRIVPGGSCNQSSDGRDAFCPTDGLTRVVANLGDEDDTYDGSPLAFDSQIDLGAGDDTIDLGGSSGADDVTGGEGEDTATYASRSFSTSAAPGVTVRLDDNANDGAQSPAEGDNIRSDVEDVIGSSHGDQLFGSAQANVLEGGLGVDSFQGNGGADTYKLRDGVVDNSFCIDGDDTVDKDLKDPPILPCGLSALRFPFKLIVFIGAVREGPNVRIAPRRLRVGQGGRVPVVLDCPAGLPRGCAGRLALREATRRPRSLGHVHYRLRSRRRGTFAVRLGAPARRRVLRRGIVELEAVERGRFGPKTTFAIRPVH